MVADPRSDAAGTARIRRFSGTERLLHWLVAATFFAMLATGACLYFPALASVLGRPVAKQLHLWSAIVLAVGFLAIAALGDRRSVLDSARAVQYSDADDVAWLRTGGRAPRGATPPPQGRFNAGQKLNTAVSSALLVLLGLTGTLLWLGERDTHWRFAGSVSIHDLASVLITFLVAGHMYLALLNPSTRHAMRGMLTGDVDLEWAREHHAKWVDEVEQGEA